MEEVALMLSQLERLDGTSKLKIYGMFPVAEDLCRLSWREVLYHTGIEQKREAGEWDPRRLLAGAEAILARSQHQDWMATGLWEDGYPPLLKYLKDPPFLLWHRGSLPARERLVSVVGTRRPDEDGRRAAWLLGHECALWRVGHVSGLAYGIDAAGHGGCIEGRGASAAVLPAGLDQISPRGNAWMAGKILDLGGCLVSEYPPGVPAAPWRYIARNRIIAGLALVTVVVQAPEKSGALITAQFALDEGRDVMVHRTGTLGPCAGGTRNLVASGAPVFSTLEEVVDGNGWTDRRLRIVPQGYP